MGELYLKGSDQLMTKDEKNNKGHNGEKTDSPQDEQLMDEQYEFGLNEDVREKIEDEDDRKEPEDKANADDKIIKD